MSSQPDKSGTFFVVATPIGNLGDITKRALEILDGVDLIAAEDTRHTGRLLARYGISKKIVSCFEHNEESRIPFITEQLKQGRSVALVVSAGTPAISDPGYRLVKKIAEIGLDIIPIPGPSSLTAAISVSGLASDRFLFLGFAPRKRSKRMEIFSSVADEPGTLIFFESPRRIHEFLKDAFYIFGNRKAVICRELTKLHEEIIRTDLARLNLLFGKEKKGIGEFTILIEGNLQPMGPLVAAKKAVELLLENTKISRYMAVKAVAKKYGVKRRDLLELAGGQEIKDHGDPTAGSGH